MAMVEKSRSEGKQTTVEEGTEFKGTLKSSCPVVVRGVLDGEVKAPSLTVAETGSVIGDVKAEIIRSDGVLAGRFDADEVILAGTVRSNTVIRARTLEVKLKHKTDKLELTFGECVLDVGDDPSKPALQAEPAAREPGAESGDAAAGASQSGRNNGALDESKPERRSVPPPS